MALVYGLVCGEVVDSDVVERRLTVTANEKVVKTHTYETSATDLGEFVFNEGDSVVFSLVDVDDAGNASEPATIEFVATDTLPPALPGGFSVSLLREVEDQPGTTVPPDTTVAPSPE